MSHDDQLTRHLRALAEAAVPDGLRPDPPLSARVETARRRESARRLGLATLAAALLVATLGLFLLSRVPDDSLTIAAQGPTALPTVLPTETPIRAEPVALTLDAEPQTIHLGDTWPAVLLSFPDEPGVLIITVDELSIRGPVVVGYRPDARPLFSFDPALTQRLRLELAEPPGQVHLFLDSGESGLVEEVTLRAWVEAPAGTPQLIPTLDVPDGTIAVALPRQQVSLLGGDPPPGTAVDVYLMMLYVNVDGEFQAPLVAAPTLNAPVGTPVSANTPQLITQRTVQGAVVAGLDDATVTLAVAPQDASALTWAIDAELPMILIPVAETVPDGSIVPDGTIVPDEPSATPALPPGKVAVALPLRPVSIIGGELAVGQAVDVYLTFMYVDVDEAFQAPLVTPPAAVGTTIASPLLGLATGTPGPAGTPQLTTQRTVQNGEVLALDAATITLAVSPQEATVLVWAIDAQVPIALIPVGGE